MSYGLEVRGYGLRVIERGEGAIAIAKETRAS